MTRLTTPDGLLRLDGRVAVVTGRVRRRPGEQFAHVLHATEGHGRPAAPSTTWKRWRARSALRPVKPDVAATTTARLVAADEVAAGASSVLVNNAAPATAPNTLGRTRRVPPGGRRRPQRPVRADPTGRRPMVPRRCRQGIVISSVHGLIAAAPNNQVGYVAAGRRQSSALAGNWPAVRPPPRCPGRTPSPRLLRLRELTEAMLEAESGPALDRAATPMRRPWRHVMS